MMGGMRDQLAWAVSSGSYSDYSILCICRTEADAQKVADAWHAHANADRVAQGLRPLEMNQYDVESFPFIDPTGEPHTVYEITEHLYLDSASVFSKPYESTDIAWGEPELTWTWEQRHETRDHGLRGRLTVSGPGLERVRKVFSDRRAMALTEPAYRLSDQSGTA